MHTFKWILITISFLNELQLICLHTGIAIVFTQLNGFNYFHLNLQTLKECEIFIQGKLSRTFWVYLQNESNKNTEDSSISLLTFKIEVNLKLDFQKLMIYLWSHCLVGRAFANGPVDMGSIPGRVIPRTLKMILDTSLLNTQHYKARIKGKVEQSRERISALPYISV